jgi:hypothetical protein
MDPRDLTGSLCEQGLDAPAVGLKPAPWSGEMRVGGACAAPRADTP